MQRLSLIQSQSQKLSPQQIQFIKLLQVPTVELETRIEQELEINPALEEGIEEPVKQDEYETGDEKEEPTAQEDINLDEYLRHDDYGGYKTHGDGKDPNAEENDAPIVAGESMSDMLNKQLSFLRLTEHQLIIATQIIGSIEEDGYIRRDLNALINDLAFSQYVETELDEVEEVLRKVQTFEPAGIGARTLQECLLLQLERHNHQDKDVLIAIEVLENHFDEFTKKHYKKIIKKLDITDEVLKTANTLITKLNPKPGSSMGSSSRTQYIIPDYLLKVEGDEIKLALNARNAPELRVSRGYIDMMDTYSKSDKNDKKMKEAVNFVKQKLDAAKWFIDAIQQRQQTLLRTMNAIIELQQGFFLDEDESRLRPMILKDIAEKIGMDISTISRVVSSKSVQTEYTIYPLKFFFSESISTETGEDVSSREVKNALKIIIDAEEKRKPISDDKICKALKEQGYNIARRTVAKYREMLNIPVARLRKEL